MKTKVEFYSVLRELAGTHEETIDLPEGATVERLLEVLFESHPAMRGWDGRLLIAADLDYVERSHQIVDGEVISVMPPVQGG